MRCFIIETLIEAFNKENDLQIKGKIAFALGRLPPQGRFPNTSTFGALTLIRGIKIQNAGPSPSVFCGKKSRAQH